MLIQAMLLGNRGEVPPALNRVFRDSGTVHIFAISGMHVALAAGVIIFLLSAVGVPRPVWGAALAPLLLAYTLFTGARPSALRAFLMASLYFGAPLVGRKPDGLATLALSALVLLAIDPFQLHDLGFLLSFVVMAGLMLLCKPLAQGFKSLFRTDQDALLLRAAEADGAPAGTRRLFRLRLRHRLLTALADLMAVSMAAWLASAPLTAWYFGRFTPGSLLANLLVVPLFFLVVVSGMLSLGAGVVSDTLSILFNHAAAALTSGMVAIARATASLPGASLRIAQPPGWSIALWYAALAILAWRLARRRVTTTDKPW
jgi:competence protein ComEC